MPCERRKSRWAFVQGDLLSHELLQIDVVVQMTERYPNFFRIARTAAEIRDLFSKGFFPSLAGMEGGHQIDSSLASLRSFYRSGVR